MQSQKCEYFHSKVFDTMRRILFFLLPVMAVMLSACQGGEEPRVKTSEATIAAEGGVYTLANGVQLVVPAGAVSESTTVQVEYAEDPDETAGPLPSDVQGVVMFGPEGLTFDKPLQVSMPLNQPVMEAKIDIFYWSSDSAKWYLTDIGVREGDQVTFYVDHFSTYAAMTGGWSDFFGQLDAAVGDKTSEEAISETVKSVLKDLYDSQFDGYHFATRANMGGQAVNICAEACGIFGFWSKEENGTVRQGGGTYKARTQHNIITSIGYSGAYASSHLGNSAISRTLELYGEPCATELTGAAKESKIEKGKTTEVTIRAHCGGDALADQLIQLSYSPELACDVVNKKTDSNGEIKITVKGVEEGKGIVYAKAVSAIAADLVTEIQIPVKVGGGDIWEITWRIPVKKTATITSVDKYNERIPALPMFRAYSYSGDTKSVSFDVVGSARIQYAGTKYIPEARMDFPIMKGTVSVTIDPASITYDYPEWTSSWEDWGEVPLQQGPQEVIAGKYKYQFTYEPHYILHPRENIGFEHMTGINNRVTLGLTGLEGEEYGPVMIDSTVFTSTLSGTAYYYSTNKTNFELGTMITGTRTEAITPEVVTGPVVSAISNQIYPSSIMLNLVEGTFPLYNWSDKSSSYSQTTDNVYMSADIDFHRVFYTESYLPYRGAPEIETTETGVGEITIRRVDEDEKE